ncbi:MAG: protoporphyrinogen oxidase [Verrucomicrobia bacterium]|jgi:oxygen-dependent protoporphyrinogen oxidase|nr:protoporphyrinogen oxidase [Verrucomicrobiota bacterium]
MIRSPSSARIAIVGGGVTGLTAAWHLHRAGLHPVVFERASRPGGVVGAVRTDGWLHEIGPNSLLEGSAEVAAFIDDAGLGPRRLYAAPEAKQRYIVRGGRLVAMPTSPLGFIGTPLFSLGAKLRLLGEPWRAPSPPQAEETVADFVVRRLGPEFLDYAINPFVAGVYAGNPRLLSVPHAFPKLFALEQEHGSLIRGALKRRNTSGGPKGRIFSFPEGLGEIPSTLGARLGPAVHLQAHVRQVRRTGTAWALDVEEGGQTAEFACDAVVCALPADALAELPIAGVPAASRLPELREILHPPVASVFTGYRREQVAHALDGFGALMPEVERGRILGTLFSSTLFPGRAPAGHVALTTFVGGMRDPEAARLDDSALLDVVRGELGRLLGARGEPVFTRIQRWPRAIPQYTVGYQRFKDIMLAVEAAAPGVYLGGNCRDGISLANCLAAGQRLARAVQAGLGISPA